MTLTDFLLARIAEDEVAAGACPVGYTATAVPEHVLDHFENWSPQRVLAECDAKRHVIEECRGLINSFGDWDAEPGTSGTVAMWDNVSRRERSQARGRLLAYAAIYADHPDYRQEWRA